jgi:hypothetical protein
MEPEEGSSLSNAGYLDGTKDNMEPRETHTNSTSIFHEASILESLSLDDPQPNPTQEPQNVEPTQPSQEISTPP